MPQASDEQRDLMAKWFPVDNEAGVDDWQPIQFLQARGWAEKAGMWSKPSPSYNPSYYEVQCLLFLRDEWDYDWLTPLFQEA